MENEFDINNLTGDDFMQMAQYVAHLEGVNKKLLDELQQAKAYLSATLQQRNSAEAKLKNLLQQRSNVVDISGTPVQTVPINSMIDLMNPEQYREKPNQR